MTLDEWRADVQRRGGALTWLRTSSGRNVRVAVWAGTPRIYEPAPLSVQAADVWHLGMESLAIADGAIVRTRDEALATVGNAAAYVAQPLLRVLVLALTLAAIVYIIAHKPSGR